MAAGAIAFVFQTELESFVEENGLLLMKQYNESKADGVKEAWDTMHDKMVGGDNSNKSWTFSSGKQRYRL